MNEDERRRFFAGRHDWKDQSWEDHCGDPSCDHPSCERNIIPGNERTAALRLSFSRSILGAEIERL